MVGDDRVIAVLPEDIEPLIKAGYERLAEERLEAAGLMTGSAQPSGLLP